MQLYPVKVRPSPSKKISSICFNESLLKIYDVTAWSTNNYNTHIVQYPTKLRLLGNEIWSGKCFFFKNHAENEQGKLVPDLFLFFKKALY